jgi:hypothetical protein
MRATVTLFKKLGEENLRETINLFITTSSTFLIKHSRSTLVSFPICAFELFTHSLTQYSKEKQSQKPINMSGTEQAYHLTKEDVRKAEQRESHAHGGNIPAGSDTAGLQVRQIFWLAPHSSC